MASRESVGGIIERIPRKRVKRHYQCNTSANETNHSVNLPNDALDKILALLPIKKAMQIGILSRRFNNSWIFSRRLDFDDEFARGHTTEDFISFVNKVFDLHSSPTILSFRLFFDANGEQSLVEKWIKKSIEKGVEEIELCFYVIGNYFDGGPIRLISDVYDVESIKILKLNFCQLDLPPKPKGLQFLNTLVLKRIFVTPALIDTLFQNCMFLETLDISQCYRIFHFKICTANLKKFKVLKVGDCPEILSIEIDAPTLHSIHYRGHICFIKFTNIPKAKDVMLNFIPPKGFTETFLARDIVYDIHHIHVLTITSTFLEGLTPKFVNGILKEMKFSFWNLKEFHLIMEGALYCNPYDIVSFIKNCQHLEKIFIDLNEFNFSSGSFWELHNREPFEQCCVTLYSLRIIKLSGFKFQKDEILLVKFFLEKAPCLQKLVLITPKSRRVKVNTQNLEACHEYLKSWKSTRGAEIAVFEHSNDRSSVFPTHSKPSRENLKPLNNIYRKIDPINLRSLTIKAHVEMKDKFVVDPVAFLESRISMKFPWPQPRKVPNLLSQLFVRTYAIWRGHDDDFVDSA
ncbi:unnamed protein product [Dovyalis caffra]|uniref:At1g61320/AtMIF1 LRR domain-containing protein n=1 Tax=Dovyalis caffra TaxID=77055 RepID=A0AAV1SI80_9ROSI|nr:unnamed protein product [Dovyalis caffra]